MKRALIIIRDGEVHERSLIEPLLPGEQGNIQTLEAMRGIVLEDRLDISIRNWVYREIIGFVPPDGSLDGLNKIFLYARDKILYQPDPFDVEIVADIWSTLNFLSPFPMQPVGDCGIKTTFIATCAALIGFKSQFAIIRQRGETRSVFTHVFPVIGINGEWVPYDATPKDSRPGWKADADVEKWFPIFD